MSAGVHAHTCTLQRVMNEHVDPGGLLTNGWFYGKQDNRGIERQREREATRLSGLNMFCSLS